MSLAGLNELHEFAVSELVELQLRDTNQQRVTEDVLNMYHLCQFFVKPLTARFQCSFMEIAADSEQSPRFFVSHAWSTVLRDTLLMRSVV